MIKMKKQIETYDFNVASTFENTNSIYKYFEETTTQQKDFINAFSSLLTKALNDEQREEL